MKKREVILKGKDFVLRKPRLTDAESLYKYQQDKEVKRNMMTIPKTLKETKREIKEMNLGRKGYIGEVFVIDINGEAVGVISFGQTDKYNKTKVKVGYWIAKKFRGKGITTKALKLITNYAFKKYKLKRMEGFCRTFNKASARVLKKAGYKFEGILRKNKFKNGKYLDDMIWAKIK